MTHPRLAAPPRIPFLYNVSRQKPGEYSVEKFGRDDAVNATFGTLWPMSNLYVYLPAATILKVSSSSVNDINLTGSGAWAVVLLGLDGDFNIAQEIVLLNGQTAVNSKYEYIRIFRMKIILPDSHTAYNVGAIYAGTGTVTDGIPQNKYCLISIGANSSHMSMATVPAKTDGYLFKYGAGTGIQNKIVDVRLMTKKVGEPFQQKHNHEFSVAGFEHEFTAPLRLPAKTDIEIQGKASGGGGSITADFFLLLDPMGERPIFL